VGEGGLNFFLEAGDELAVGGDQRLLDLDLGEHDLLRSEGHALGNTHIENVDRGSHSEMIAD
jgi:hypothetical protein